MHGVSSRSLQPALRDEPFIPCPPVGGRVYVIVVRVICQSTRCLDPLVLLLGGMDEKERE
ncbi:hypothetical protein E2C01_089273 [Portunus trituberculatus]|uniref:Uncharacterized protein n=1 Tax=Portunus trituberculatus TaxID=210409 RepID=A0A5B7J8C9_PORTR|nr:hypothetical protein [Portunus trituberculatus]